MWLMPDWGWGMAFHMFGWWLIVVIGLGAAIALIVRTLSRREDRGAPRP
jgi:hypothetical protein